MVNGLIGRKVGMTQVYDTDGRVVPVTVIEAGPCVITQIKTLDNDGYEAVQLGLVEKKPAKNTNKPTAGHLKKSGAAALRHMREFKLNDGAEVNLGDQVLVNLFSPEDKVAVTGVSKGKGFQGVIARHGFGGGRQTHGSHFHRAPGSIGQCATPSRVFPGKKMPGQTGNKKVTTKNLQIVRVIEDKNLLLIKGAVPGSKGGVITINKL